MWVGKGQTHLYTDVYKELYLYMHKSLYYATMRAADIIINITQTAKTIT